ncbi:MAG: hypothetical protein ABH891_07085 [Candidatus Omnitrophota bacterium]
MSINRTVYILGAGFSKTFDLPLANEFLGMLVNNGTSETFADKINTTCINFYPSFRTALANYPNVEDFYNYFRSLINYYELLGVPLFKYVSDFKKEFHLEIGRLLDKKIENFKSENEQYLNQFCQRLKPGDAVITFNWDNLIEKQLDKIQKKYEFRFNITKQDIVILKLHGSIDWFSVDELPKDAAFYTKILQYDDGKRTKYLIRACQKLLRNEFEEKGQEAFFIPPLLQKDELFIPIKDLWASAYSLLRNSLNKTYIGYSFPKEDTMSRVLFSGYPYFAVADEDERLAGKERITVINPDENMEAHYKKYCHDKIWFVCMTYKRFVDVVNEKKATEKAFFPFKEKLLNCSDKYIQRIANIVFDRRLSIITEIEKKRLKEYTDSLSSFPSDSQK